MHTAATFHLFPGREGFLPYSQEKQQQLLELARPIDNRPARSCWPKTAPELGAQPVPFDFLSLSLCE